MHSKLRPSSAMVVALIALFVALGGSAAALSGSNTVFTDDIANDTQPASGGNPAGGLVAADLRPGSVGQSEIAAGGVAAGEIAAGGVAESEVLNGSLGTSEFSNSIPATRVTHSSAQSIPDFPPGATLAFNTERYDTASMHDNATNNSRLTAPVTGIYAVTAEVDWTPDATGTRELTLMKNGSTFIADDDRDGISVVFGGQSQSVTAQVRLVAGDFVEVGVLQTSGGSLNVMSAGETSPEFSLTWLAPGP
jgi:hypothetical protein